MEMDGLAAVQILVLLQYHVLLHLSGKGVMLRQEKMVYKFLIMIKESKDLKEFEKKQKHCLKTNDISPVSVVCRRGICHLRKSLSRYSMLTSADG